MKKTLVAVAALVATGAFAEVTISGVYEAAIKSTGSTKTVIGGTNGTEISFGVSEDLGNGLKAIGSTTLCANIAGGSTTSTCGVGAVSGTVVAGAHGANTTTNTGAINNYNSYVGVSSAEFGTVKIGQQFSTTFFVGATGDVFGMSGLSNYMAAGDGAGQIANSLTYNSPSISGINVNYQQTLDNATGTVGSTNYSLTYSNGGLNAAIGSSKLTTGTAETVIGGNYNFGVASIYAGSRTQSGAKTATGYGVAVPFGALTLAAGISSNGTVNATAYAASYNLSKRTSVYAAQGTSDASATATYVGVRHNF